MAKALNTLWSKRLSSQALSGLKKDASITLINNQSARLYELSCLGHKSLTVQSLDDFIAAGLQSFQLSLMSHGRALALLRLVFRSLADHCPKLQKQYQKLRERGSGGFTASLFEGLEALHSGEIPENFSKEQIKELKQCAQRFNQVKLQNKALDRSHALAWLIAKLKDTSKDKDAGGLTSWLHQSCLIFDQSDLLSSLEKAFIEACLNHHKNSYWVTDQDLIELAKSGEGLQNPSVDAVTQSLSLLSIKSFKDRVFGLKNTRKGSAKLVSALFDGLGTSQLKKQNKGLELWSCHDHREEVARVTERLKELFANKVKASELVVAMPEPSRYGFLFEELTQKLGKKAPPLVFTQGRSLGLYPAGLRLKSLLSWLLTGNSTAMLAFYSALAQSPSIHESELSSFRQRHPVFEQLFKELETKGEFLKFDEDGLHHFNCQRLHAAMRKAQARGGSHLSDDWLWPLYTSARSWIRSKFESLHWLAHVLLDLAALEKSWQGFEHLRDPEQSLEQRLLAVKELCQECPEDQDHEDNKRAFLAVHKTLDELLDDERFSREQAAELKVMRDLREDFFQRLLSLFNKRRLEPELSPQKNGLLIVQLSELRSLNPKKQVFVLGLTAGSDHSKDTGELRWILGKTLRMQSPLVLSVPRVEDNIETRPMSFWLDLKRWQDQKVLPLEREDPFFEDSFSSQRLKPSKAFTEQVKRSVTVLEQRVSPQMTPYDGDLGDIDLEPELANEYSPTMLEVLADCPHRHFFSNMLYLQEFPEVRDELPRHEVGTVVHECLEIFWDGDEKWEGAEELRVTEIWRDGPISPENFDKACLAIKKIALKVLKRSGIDWDRGPLRRYDCKRILLGLEEPGDIGPRGLLKAALSFQKDLPFLSGPPFQTEWKFGMRGEKPTGDKKPESPPVKISDKVSARGIIDRLDLRTREDGSTEFLVLDYKTGRGKSIRDVEEGRALQIAIYAMAALQNFPHASTEDKPARVRGGLLILGEPNRREGAGRDVLDHPTYGVYREHITAKKSGRSWISFDDKTADEDAQGKLELARKRIDELDSRVRKGQLWQNLHPKACPYCDYRDICFHDEVTLSQKLAHQQGLEVPEKSHFEMSAALKRPEKQQPRAESQLSKEQELAASADLSASVSAGAGSGKTFILKTRVARLIRAGVPVSAILAITFTEKAALEIRERIEQALGEALDSGFMEGQALTDDERQYFVRARSDMATASISTIHSFCHDLIALDPLLSRLPPSLEVVSGPELSDIESQILRSLFSNQSPVAEDIEALLSEGLYTSQLRRQIRIRLSDQASLRRLKRGLNRSQEDWLKVFPKLQDWLLGQRLQTAREALKELLEKSMDWAHSKSGTDYLESREPRRDEFETVLEHLQTALIEISQEDYVDASRTLFECLQRMVEVNGAVGFRKSAKKLPVNWWKAIRDELTRMDLPEPQADFERELWSLESAKRLLSIFEIAQDLYQRRKRELGVVDFEDLIERCHQMLVGEELKDDLKARRTRLLKSLHERFRHILVDEFQDTDQRQWDIVQSLIKRRPDWEEDFLERGLSKPTAFIVGDPKQSIYGWRRSDNRVFEKARAFIKNELGGLSLDLKDNYRSSQAVIDWVNTFFENVFSSEFLIKDQGLEERIIDTAVHPQAMRAAGQHPEGSVKVLWIPKGNISKDLPPFLQEESGDEFHAIARLTASILKGDPRFKVPYHKGPVIGILCRTTRTLRGLGQALEQSSIPYSSSHRAGFFSQFMVVVLETALRALVFEEDDVSLTGLLRGPLIAWTDRDLFDCKRDLHAAHKSQRWTLSLRRGLWDDVRGQAFSKLYEKWFKASRTLPPSALLRLILEDSGIDQALLKSDRMASLRNIWRLIEMVESVEGRFHNGLIELLAWMTHQRNTAPEGSALAPADDIPVVLTTIHGSKGLEFPIVILPGLARRAQQDHDFLEIEIPGDERAVLGLKVVSQEESYRRTDTLLTTALKQRCVARTRSEEKRLFYVACTRAKHHLVLPIMASKSLKFSGQESHETMRRALRESTNHRALVCHSAIADTVDTKDQPKSFEFRAPSLSVEVPVIEVPGSGKLEV